VRELIEGLQPLQAIPRFHELGDILRLQIRTVRARAARIDHEYQLFRGNELLAEAQSTLACIDRQGRVQRLPDFLLSMSESSAGE
jgi:acyl-CoA thioester hydrolase